MRYILAFLLLVPLCAATEITEVMFDPPGEDNNREWVEVMTSEDLEGWYIADSDSRDILRLVKKTGSDYSLIVEEGFSEDVPCTLYSAGSAIGNTLNNDGDTVTLLDPDLQIVSSVSYSGPQPEATPCFDSCYLEISYHLPDEILIRSSHTLVTYWITDGTIIKEPNTALSDEIVEYPLQYGYTIHASAGNCSASIFIEPEIPAAKHINPALYFAIAGAALLVGYAVSDTFIKLLKNHNEHARKAGSRMDKGKSHNRDTGKAQRARRGDTEKVRRHDREERKVRDPQKRVRRA